MRPDLRIDAAFTDGAKPEPRPGGRIPGRAGARRGGRGASPCHVHGAVGARRAHRGRPGVRSNPQTRVRASDVVGADATLLSVLDERMRTALRLARVRELDAVVLAATGSGDARVIASIARLARLWSVHHHLPTSIAFANTSPPSTGEAVRDWRRQGKRHVAVGSLFITSGPHSDRAAELALEAGACAVSAPLGEHEAAQPPDRGPLLRRRPGARPRLTIRDFSPAPSETSPPTIREFSPRPSETSPPTIREIPPTIPASSPRSVISGGRTRFLTAPGRADRDGSAYQDAGSLRRRYRTSRISRAGIGSSRGNSRIVVKLADHRGKTLGSSGKLSDRRENSRIVRSKGRGPAVLRGRSRGRAIGV